MLDIQRHAPLFNPARWQDEPIAVVGCGGLGSHLAMYLARLGLRRIVLVDGSLVKRHNIANQMFDRADIGSAKTDAMARTIHRSVGATAHAVPFFVREKRELGTVVFLCVDRMDARKKIMEECLFGNPKVQRVIDGRMDASHGTIYSIDPRVEKHRARWTHEWFPDEAAENETAGCGGSLSIVYTPGIVAGLMAHELVLWSAWQGEGVMPGSVRWISLSDDKFERVWWK